MYQNGIVTRNSAGVLEMLAGDGVLSVRAGTRLEDNPPAMISDAAPPLAVVKGVNPYKLASTNDEGGDIQVEGGDFGGTARVGGRPGTFAEVVSLPKRIQLMKQFGAQGLVQLNASLAAGVDADFEILGTNASNDDVTFNPEGGLILETDGGLNDQIIVLPHLAGQSPWTGFTWGTDRSVKWGCYIETGAAITAEVIWAGLKLTNTPVVATDADQVFFRYEAGVGSGAWQCINSIGGTDDTDTTDVTVADSTLYHLEIEIDSSRIARFYINGVLVATSAALTDAIDLIPYIGIQAGAAAAKSMTIHGEYVSRDRLAV